MIWCYKKNRENHPGKCFWIKKKKPGLKFNPGLALIGLRTTGPVLYREYCIQDGNLVPRFSQGRARCMLRCQFFQRHSWYKSESEYLSDLLSDTPGRANSIWIRIRVDVEIFESRKKVADSKISDTCGRSLNLFSCSLPFHSVTFFYR